MNTQPITWEGPLSTESMAIYLKNALFGSAAEQATLEALYAEAVRIALWERSVLNQLPSMKEAITSTQHILSRVRLLLKPYFSLDIQPNLADDSEQFSEDAFNRQLLDDLAEQGDLFSMSQGYWLPTPLRLVPITSDLYLLVGGMPSSLLTSEVLQYLHLHGSFRQMEAGVLKISTISNSFDAHWQFQTQENWLGEPFRTLSDIIQEFQKTQLLEVAAQTYLQDIEVYIPSPNKTQIQRWCLPQQAPDNKHYLLKSQAAWGRRLYSIGEFKGGLLKRQSSILAARDIRHLCYALDYEAKMPTTATWNKQQGQLILFNELPSRERKRLALFGSLQKNQHKYYPRFWQLPPQYEQEYLMMLSDLHINVQLIMR